MAVVIASDLGKDLAGEPLLRGISFKLERRDRMTLAGRNGAGKTTLLRMLAGEASVDHGELVLAKDVRVALHDQRPPRKRDLSLREYMLTGARELVAIEEQLNALEQAMAGGAHDEGTLARYAEAQARLEHAGGYGWRQRALAMLKGLGFRDERELDRPLHTFSGGELTRASLGRALVSAPDLLLLDEPTNHLDIESLEWLEQHLIGLDAAVVLVAHDSWFLEGVGTSVLELEAGRGRFFPGPWHVCRRERAALNGRARDAPPRPRRVRRDAGGRTRSGRCVGRGPTLVRPHAHSEDELRSARPVQSRPVRRRLVMRGAARAACGGRGSVGG